MNTIPKTDTAKPGEPALLESKARKLLSAIENTISVLDEMTKSAIEIRDQIRKRSAIQRARQADNNSSLSEVQENDLLDLEALRNRMTEGDHSMDSARRSLMELMQDLSIAPNHPLIVQDLARQLATPLAEQLLSRWETAKSMRSNLALIQANNQTILIYLVDYYRQLLMVDHRDAVKPTYGSKGTVEQGFESRIVKANC